MATKKTDDGGAVPEGIGAKELDTRFGSVFLNDADQRRAEQIAEGFRALAGALDELVPGTSREKSLAVTELQSAKHWATEAVCRQSSGG